MCDGLERSFWEAGRSASVETQTVPSVRSGKDKLALRQFREGAALNLLRPKISLAPS